MAEPDDRLEISVVVPVYAGAGCLDELHRRLVENLETITEDFEIILTEDCGPDDSWARIQEIAAKDPRVRGQQLSRNFGQHPAITAGLASARGNWIVVMDCDLQDRPEEIPRLYAKAQEGFDVVLARRAQRQDKWSKKMSSVMFYATFNYLTDLNYDGSVANFSCVSRQVVRQLLQMEEAVRFYGGFLNWMASRRRTSTSNTRRDTRVSRRTHSSSCSGWRSRSSSPTRTNRCASAWGWGSRSRVCRCSGARTCSSAHWCTAAR
ncbi:MAG: glycosyltransferase family 2 protein [Deltaproteobacteria bacterium]